tara:strand:- start:71 stop:634 length:564 start_codon:yes stop_codon:yes gene_type:complete
MANQDAAFGFRPVRHLSGGELRTNEYKIANNYGTVIYQGQVVKAVAAGGIEAAAAGNVVLGIFGGCFFTDPTTSKPTFSNYYPASTAAADIVAFVYDDPRIVFEAQHDGTGTAAMNFSGFDLVGVSGSTTTGRSSSELDTSSSTTSGQFKQIGISKDPNNSDVATANCNAYVVPNTGEHTHLLTTAI